MKPSNRQFVGHDQPATRANATGLPFQRGFSLIELMISITIGLVILIALSTLFINQSRARIEMDKSNRMIDNGRYALQLLSDDLRQAGYYGEFVPASGVPAVPSSLPDPCSVTATDMANADGAFALQLPVQGYATTLTTTATFSPACAAIATANSVTLKPGSDIVVVRRVSTATPIVQSVGLSGVFYLQASLCQYDSVPFKIDTNPANLTLRQLGCTATSTTPYANLRQFMVDVYFVSQDDKAGDGIPTLKEIQIDPNTQNFVVTPLVEGIEYMQLEYGLDTNGDGIADNYITGPATADWPNVVAVKMHLLARNTESTRNYTDTKTYSLGPAGSVTPSGANAHYKRHVYSQYIRMVNTAGRRE